MIEIREAQLRWRASTLTRAIATCAALALAAGLIGSCWQLIAFAAPLLGVLCSISWQRPLPKVNVHAEPGSQRCFETEQAQLTLWADTETFGTAVELTVSAIDGMRLEVLQRTSRQRQTVATTAHRWGRYPIRATVDVIAQKLRQAGFSLSTRSVDRIIEKYGLQKKTLSLPPQS